MDSFIYGGPDLATVRMNMSLFDYHGPKAITLDDITIHKIKLYIYFAVNTTSFMTVVWVILKKSPHTMRTYKFLLLHIVIWIYLRDILMNVLWMPYLLSPAPGGCIVGVFKYFGESVGKQMCMILLIFTSAGTGYSCNVAQLYRFYAFNAAEIDSFRKLKSIIAIFALAILSPAPAIVSYLFARNPDTDKVSTFFINNYPFTRSLMLKLPCGSVNVDGNRLAQIVFYSIILIMVLCSVATSFGLLTASLLKLKKIRTQYVQSEVNLHRQIVTALLIQSILPFLCVGLPSTLLASHRLSEMKLLGTISAILFETGSLHTVFNAIVIIVLIKPYRRVVLSWVPCVTRLQNVPFIIRNSSVTVSNGLKDTQVV